MKIWKYPGRQDWKSIVGRQNAETPAEIRDSVAAILKDVAAEGDAKVLEYVRKFDGFSADKTAQADTSKQQAACLKVSPEEIGAAEKMVPDGLKTAIAAAAENIRKFHAAQIPEDIAVETMPGVICMQKNIPMQTVGLYIPGGTAPLFSTVLMLAVPAKLAGVERIVMCTPPDKSGKVSPLILYAASVCGVDEIYRIGGAVAVAAMAYGTQTVPKADKIFGPGNAYVTEAKQQISRICAIDMPAGPSEVMIIADANTPADFVCADFLSQLEHGRDSQAILLTTSEALADAVSEELPRQEAVLSRKSFVDLSLSKSAAVVLSSEAEMMDFANFYAPEHLIISTENYNEILKGIRNAGSVFLGRYSPESAGDYASGTNHTLPTGGWAVSCSGVNLSSFMKKMTVQEISEAGLRSLAPVIGSMAMAEGLDAHANAVTIRLKRT